VADAQAPMGMACTKQVGVKADAEARIKVPEMHCGNCVGPIRGGLRDVPGIASSEFDLGQRVVTVRWASGLTNRQAIEAAITRAGFKVENAP
jgi:copper chaperone CopZ